MKRSWGVNGARVRLRHHITIIDPSHKLYICTENVCGTSVWRSRSAWSTEQGESENTKTCKHQCHQVVNQPLMCWITVSGQETSHEDTVWQIFILFLLKSESWFCSKFLYDLTWGGHNTTKCPWMCSTQLHKSDTRLKTLDETVWIIQRYEGWEGVGSLSPLCGIIRALVAPYADPPQISYSLLRFDIKSRVGSRRLKLWMEGTSSCTQARMGQKTGSCSSLWKTSISAHVAITRHGFRDMKMVQISSLCCDHWPRSP